MEWDCTTSSVRTDCCPVCHDFELHRRHHSEDCLGDDCRHSLVAHHQQRRVYTDCSFVLYQDLVSTICLSVSPRSIHRCRPADGRGLTRHRDTCSSVVEISVQRGGGLTVAPLHTPYCRLPVSTATRRSNVLVGRDDAAAGPGVALVLAGLVRRWSRSVDEPRRLWPVPPTHTYIFISPYYPANATLVCVLSDIKSAVGLTFERDLSQD